MGASAEIEQGLRLTPRFDKDGLIAAISQDARTGQVLMMAYMNAEALRLTIETGNAVFYSRSRRKLWKKGEQSGHVQKIRRILVDCDQDCVLLQVDVDEGQCHAGYQSCFYRAVKSGSPDGLELVAEKVYDPDKAYGR